MAQRRREQNRIVKIGPFSKGLNNFSDPSAIPDDALAELTNMELDLDGSLVSRPPFENLGIGMSLDSSGNMNLLGMYYTPGGAEYLIGTDGVSNTYYLSAGAWVLLTDTFAATAMTQFDDKAWLLAPVGSANPGGTWTPSAGFVAEPNMPKGTVIVSFKFRLWIAQGEQATTNGSRLYFSKLLGVSPFWPSTAEFVDIAKGDGQAIVSVHRYYESLLVFRTESIYRYQYVTDPATGIIEASVPNIGLDTRHSIVAYENFFYFVYDGRAYQYMNGRAHDISQAVVFKTDGARTGYAVPFSVSLFADRLLFSHYDTLYVFSLKTNTWSAWKSPEHGAIGKVLERRNSGNEAPQAYTSTSKNPPAQLYTNTYVNPDFESSFALPAGGTISTDWSVTGSRSLYVQNGPSVPSPETFPSSTLYPIP